MEEYSRNMTSPLIEGHGLSLRPMLLTERRKFFRWAVNSDATSWWYGDLYGDQVPGYEAFRVDWSDDYFDVTKPEAGQCFMITADGKEIGQINYNPISKADRSTDMDILIASKEYYGKGIGSAAISLLSDWILSEMQVSRIRIEVVRQNTRAFRSYEKAGFNWIYTYILNQIEWKVLEKLPA